MITFPEHNDTDLFLYSYKNFSFPTHFHSEMEIIMLRTAPLPSLLTGRRGRCPGARRM